MKIDINPIENKDFYDYLLYILMNITKIQNNKIKTIKKITSFCISKIIISLLAALFSLILYINEKEQYFLITFIILTILFLIFIFLYLSTIKKINNFLLNKLQSKLIIDKDKIELQKGNINSPLKWDEIDKIIYTNDIICFIPKNIKNVLIAVESIYQEEVLNGIKKYNKEDLIVKEK